MSHGEKNLRFAFLLFLSHETRRQPQFGLLFLVTKDTAEMERDKTSAPMQLSAEREGKY